jgi:hypothetical protein
MSNLLNPSRFETGAAALTLDDALGGWSTYELFSTGWSSAAMWTRRTSDNATAYIFFDGSGTISTSSFISTTSATTPSATTLGTWSSGTDVVVNELYFQTPDDASIDSNYTLKQNNSNYQPHIVTAGVVDTDANGMVGLVGDAQSWLHQTSYVPIPELADTNDWGIFDLISTNSNSQNMISWCNLSRATGVDGNNSRVVGYCSKLTGGFISLVRDDTLANNIVYSTVGAGGYFYRLHTHAHVAADKSLTSAIQNNYSDSNYYGTSTYTTGYQNDGFVIMAQLFRNTELSNGHWNGCIIFDQDITADRSALYTEIRTLFSDNFD